jgi:hypothetical protein
VSCVVAVQVIVVTPLANGASELRRVHVPCALQSYIGGPSLRVANMVTLLPVAVAVPTLTVAWQSLSAFAVWFDGQVIVADPDGLTVTVKLHVSPDAELAVTTVVPTGKKQSLQWLVEILPQALSPVGSG